MTLVDIARGYYAAQAGLADRSRETAATMWAELDPTDLSGSWTARRLGERLFVMLAQSQLLAAQVAARYVARALGAQGARSAPRARLVPRTLAGIASDGRDLESLLAEPLIRVKTAIRDGATPDAALAVGGSSLSMMAGTQVADAGRVATTVAMAVEPAVTGWVRMLVPPSCGRCAVLAGRRYRWSDGFERHPLCDCVHVPAAEDGADDLRTDPQAYFGSLSAADQERYFTKAGAEAIRLGSDIAQVVNARRGAAGLSRPGRLTVAEQRLLRGGRDRGSLQRVDVYGRPLAVTSEGVTVRGVAGKRLARTGGAEKRPGQRYSTAKTPRLMPEAVLELAHGDRDEAIRLLSRFGYVV